MFYTPGARPSTPSQTRLPQQRSNGYLGAGTTTSVQQANTQVPAISQTRFGDIYPPTVHIQPRGGSEYAMHYTSLHLHTALDFAGLQPPYMPLGAPSWLTIPGKWWTDDDITNCQVPQNASDTFLPGMLRGGEGRGVLHFVPSNAEYFLVKRAESWCRPSETEFQVMWVTDQL